MNWLLSLCPRCFRRSTVAELTSDYLKEIDREIFSRKLAIIRLDGEVSIFRAQRDYLEAYQQRYVTTGSFPPVA